MRDSVLVPSALAMPWFPPPHTQDWASGDVKEQQMAVALYFYCPTRRAITTHNHDTVPTTPPHTGLGFRRREEAADGCGAVLPRQAGASSRPREGGGRGRHRGLLHAQG